MHALQSRHLLLSATDVSNYLACGHLTLLDKSAALGEIGKPPRFDDPGLDALRQRGLEHERRYLERLRAEGRTVVEIARQDASLPPEERWRRAAEETAAAMRTGRDVIYQGCLFDGTWLGLPDFLQRIEQPSDLGAWSYEIVDAKLAREAKAGALLQVLLYANLLSRFQGRAPENVHLALGGPEPKTESFRVADFAAYFRSIRRRFVGTVETHAQSLPVAPEPVAHCAMCAWSTRCDRERRDVDHLSLVAGIRRSERNALVDRGISTVEALAQLPLPIVPRLGGVSDVAFERIREQARIQIEGRRAGAAIHELLHPIVPEQGLAMLPEPSDGDLFFDLEGDPYAFTHGIEYLFGFVDRQGVPISWWALDRESEKAVFERFIDLVTSRLREYPDMHIYHYAPYEPTAMKRLMGRHASREDEVDRLLRGRVFVDLYRVVRQAIRASVESYSIKKLEPLYGYTRDVDLRSASNALANFEAWLQLGGGARNDTLLAAIEGYNRDDCVSTLRLAEWLEQQHAEHELQVGEKIPRPAQTDAEASEGVTLEQNDVAELVSRLTDKIPADPADRTQEEAARWLLAQLLGYHRRESKSTWWEFFRCMALTNEEMIEDRATLGGLTYEGVIDTVKRSEIHRYRFPPQDHDVRPGTDVRDPATERSPGSIVEIDDDACTVDLKRGANSNAPHPHALVPLEYVDDTMMRESLRLLARAVLAHGLGDANPHRGAVDLLLRGIPRAGQSIGDPLANPGKEPVEAGRGLVHRLDRSALPIQGPPGAGKTYTAARMIVEALKSGKRVGVTATSHKVIANLLGETCRAARQDGVTVSGIQKATGEQVAPAPEIASTNDNSAVRQALDERTANLAAGTAWLWSREEMQDSVDLLFIDEAGQFSLANALAVAPGASSLVLVGDPRQLQQPQQGVHPPGVEISVLDHLLGDAATIAPDRGLFLAKTWRLHPDICAFTSEIFYDGRLESRTGLERQTIIAPEPLRGSGLRLVFVEHEGRQSESPEEVQAVATLVEQALSGGKWVDADGAEWNLTPGDIKVVAPYNAHVGALRVMLPAGVQVGTVDKFQGQEAALVFYSMATSSPQDAPRGMDFLYSSNRLNVATSRAKCLAVVVASPLLFTPDCRTPEHMRLANAFCALEEHAQ